MLELYHSTAMVTYTVIVLVQSVIPLSGALNRVITLHLDNWQNRGNCLSKFSWLIYAHTFTAFDMFKHENPYLSMLSNIPILGHPQHKYEMGLIKQ